MKRVVRGAGAGGGRHKRPSAACQNSFALDSMSTLCFGERMDEIYDGTELVRGAGLRRGAGEGARPCANAPYSATTLRKARISAGNTGTLGSSEGAWQRAARWRKRPKSEGGLAAGSFMSFDVCPVKKILNRMPPARPARVS